MKATYTRGEKYQGLYSYQPAILRADGTKETIWGPPLCSISDAKKYAQIEINQRINLK